MAGSGPSTTGRENLGRVLPPPRPAVAGSWPHNAFSDVKRLWQGAFMKYRIYILAMTLVVFSVSWAFSQDDMMLLKSDELGAHERPLVQFPHTKHVDIPIFCNQCHHDYDAHGNNKIKGEEDVSGQKCAECHGKLPSEKNPVMLLEAMHTACKGCHENIAPANKKAGPVMCGECHKR
jgi:predicted CXXCH cytochrome family protein